MNVSQSTTGQHKLRFPDHDKQKQKVIFHVLELNQLPLAQMILILVKAYGQELDPNKIIQKN